jgi:Na+-driven multidrug efflux pump
MSMATAFSYVFIGFLVAVGEAAEIILGHKLGKSNFDLTNIFAKRFLWITFVIAVFFSFVIYGPSFYSLHFIM